jgi:hypothetical protein
MLLIPGILASKFTPQGDFESIATVTVGSGGAASISFSSIPATYQHLQLRFIAQDVSSAQYFLVSYNGETSTSFYTWHALEGNGTTAVAFATATGTFSGNVVNYAAGATGSIFSAGVIDILDYANTNKNKTFRALAGYDANGSGFIILNSGLFLKTDAISSISITYNGGTNFAQNSQVALYGIKG